MNCLQPFHLSGHNFLLISLPHIGFFGLFDGLGTTTNIKTSAQMLLQTVKDDDAWRDSIALSCWFLWSEVHFVQG